jgi:hypothetical protein
MNRSDRNYRPDIDGLRALAIAPVVAFHAFPQWVPGGFIGVDVFFVISGYLISTILLEALDDRTFSLTGFYVRRIRRIFPALVVVLVACLLWGWRHLFASEYSQLGKHTAASAGFIANLVFWSEAGYFDTISEAKPLLHLWSLGIEEQFYLIWPALLYVTWSGRRRLTALLTVGIVVSFLYNVVLVRTDEVAAFFSPATRLWELLLGAALAYVTLARTRTTFASTWTDRFWAWYSPAIRESGALVGIAAIAASVFLFNEETSFPGWRAAIPAGGALLLVGAGGTAWVNSRLLSRPVLVWLGLVSYPLYLWHWPLLSFASVNTNATTTMRWTVIAASLVLASATYRLVEHPVRFKWRGGTPIAALGTLMLMLGAAGYITYLREGFIERPINRSDEAHFLQYYERLRTRGLSEAYRAECDFMDWATERTRDSIDASCTEPGERGTVFLWGDSHAQALSAGLRHLMPDGWRLAQVTTSACPPRVREPDPQALHQRCSKANTFARDRVAALKPRLVVLAQILGHESTDWQELASDLRSRGAERVLLVGPMPQWFPSLPRVVVNHYWGRDFTYVDDGLNPEIVTIDRALKARLSGSTNIEYVSIVDALCSDRGCRATTPGDDDPLLVVDNGHLSPAGSRYVAETVLRPSIGR